MYRNKLKTLIAFILGLILMVGIARPLLSLNPTPHLIVALQPTQPIGQIKFKRANEKDYKPAFIGVVLSGADKILLARNAVAEIMCQNFDSWKPKGGKEYTVSQGCRSSSSSSPSYQPWDEDTIIERSINDPNIPYLITPRNTALLKSELLLSWNRVPQATNYTVQLIGPNGIIWTKETTATQLIYKDTANFKAGSRYWLIVTTNQGETSQKEGSYGFYLLTPQQAEEVAMGKTEIEAKQLSPKAKALALANFELGYDLNQEAINVLEAAIGNKIESATIYRLLGDSYKKVGLNRLAVERYTPGITLAKMNGDKDSEESMERNFKLTQAIINPS